MARGNKVHIKDNWLAAMVLGVAGLWAVSGVAHAAENTAALQRMPAVTGGNVHHHSRRRRVRRAANEPTRRAGPASRAGGGGQWPYNVASEVRRGSSFRWRWS